MKFNVKGLVFVGFAAAILSANAMAATGDEKVVTSKKYVDDTFQIKGSYEVTTAKETSKTSLASNKTSTTNYPSNAAITGYVDDAISGQNLGGTYEVLTNKTQTVSNQSTESQYPSAKAVYDFAKDHQENVIETVKVNGAALTATNKAVDITVPTATSALSNDSGFITKSVNDLDNYTTTTVMNEALATKANNADLATVAKTGAYSDLSGTPTLATVATSGSYSDLSNQPSTMTGATNVAAGTSGFVPAPAAGDNVKFLTGAGTWDTPTNTTYTADNITVTLDGTQFKAKTGSIAENGTDLVTSGTIHTALADKQDASTAVKYAGSAVGSATTPVYVDGSGNIIASTYTIQTSVPANAVFTDTTYTADGTTITLNGGKFSATAGSIASGNTGLVNGGAVFSYVDGKLVPTLPTDANACTDAAPCALVATSSGMAWVKMAQPQQ